MMRKYLNGTEQKEIEEIIEASNEYDRTDYSVPSDADLWLLSCHYGKIVSFLAVYFMGDTHEGHPVDEVLLFTHPLERGKKRAGRLFEKYCAYVTSEYKEIPHARFTVYPSEKTESFLEHMDAVHEGDELLMTRMLSGSADLPEEDLCFSNEHSECSVRTYGDTAYIYGVRTDASYLRRGSAERLLTKVISELSEKGAGKALLQVSSLNTPAVRLYEKLLFTVEERMELWYDNKLSNF